MDGSVSTFMKEAKIRPLCGLDYAYHQIGVRLQECEGLISKEKFAAAKARLYWEQLAQSPIPTQVLASAGTDNGLRFAKAMARYGMATSYRQYLETPIRRIALNSGFRLGIRTKEDKINNKLIKKIKPDLVDARTVAFSDGQLMLLEQLGFTLAPCFRRVGHAPTQPAPMPYVPQTTMDEDFFNVVEGADVAYVVAIADDPEPWVSVRVPMLRPEERHSGTLDDYRQVNPMAHNRIKRGDYLEFDRYTRYAVLESTMDRHLLLDRPLQTDGRYQVVKAAW